MTTEQLIDLKIIADNHGCSYLEDEALSRHTTFKVGGSCPIMIFINSEAVLKDILVFCKSQSVKLLVLGNGSNVLCSDNGFDGVVAVIGRDFQQIKLIGNDEIEVEAGCTLTQLCSFALNNSLSGLEFAYGIPGTVGGAIYMNAGAYDGEISMVITEAEAVDSTGKASCFTAEEMKLGYRKSIFQTNGFIITKAFFKLVRSDAESIKNKMDEFMARRKDKQPLEYPSAGSTFKRPQGTFAGKLIDECGLRGYTVGGAQVSEKHCGFVINRGNATFKDITTLINNVQDIVNEKTGYTLECEVRIIE